jgi:hypothetical protein
VATADPTSPPKGVSVDRLYSGPLEEFTPARNELAKELRGGGDAEAADWVKDLRKPTRAAWIVNQLAARRKKDIATLLKRSEELRAQQEALIGGSADSDRLRDAARAEQLAIDRLLETAREIGAEHGVGATVLDRVAETLQAASSDPDVAEAIRLGRLTREQRATSLGLVGPAGPLPAAKPKREAEDAAERKARSEAAKQRRAVERQATAAERRREREQAAVERARRELEERESRLGEAERELDAARQALKKLR